MEGRRRGRFPSKDELELWARVTHRDEPLARRWRIARQASAAQAQEAAIAVAPREKPAEVQSAPPQPAVKPSVAAKNAPATPPPPQPFDPRAAKRIARGHHEINRGSIFTACARRTLMPRCAASSPAAKRRAIAMCLSYRQRVSRRERSEPRFLDLGRARRSPPPRAPLAMRAFDAHARHKLHESPAIQHGGSGALYVTIRKSPRSRG